MGGGGGGSSERPLPSRSSTGGGGGGTAALLCWGSIPEEAGEEEGGGCARGGGRRGPAARGRQRPHTRLYPVEISRALKSSESMLPVCFCSRTQGQQRRPGPEKARGAAPCAQQGDRTVAGAGETGGPGRPGKGEGVQRDTGQGGGKRASEMAHTWQGVGWREGGETERRREREKSS